MSSVPTTVVTTATSATIPQPASDTAAILHMVERASRDPSVDVDKMLRLFEMRDRYKAEAAREAFDTAMAAAQSEMRAVVKDSANPQTRSKYATYHAIDKELRPVYSKHGFSLSFDTGEGTPENVLRVLCRVANGGHRETYHIDMPADGKGAKGNDVMTRTHATGSAATYGRRYLLLMIFNVSLADEASDDDGNGASTSYITAEQVAYLRELLQTHGRDEARFLQFLQLDKLEDIYTNRYAAVANIIKNPPKVKR